MLRQTFNIPVRVFLLTMILASVSLVTVYSSSASYASRKHQTVSAKNLEQIQKTDVSSEEHDYHDMGYAKRQFAAILIGLVALLIMYRVDYRLLKDTGPYLLGLSFILLCLVFVPGVGKKINDHYRWIGFGSFNLGQPSELAKLALIIYMARMLTDHHDKLKSFFHGVIPALALTGVFGFVIIIEPDIGATVVTMTIIFFMWFIGGMRILHLFGLFASGIPPIVFAIIFFPNRLERLWAYLHVLYAILFSNDPSVEVSMGKGYQLMQSLIAVGSGGVTGVGLGNSMQKYFLTEQFSDFIFAIVSEELGFIGAALIVLCYFLLIWEGWRIALRAPDYYSTLLASGITLMLTISVSLNLMVVTGLAPTKGLALPLMSYGISNMIVTMAAVGILMNIGKYVEFQLEATRESRRNSPEKRTAKQRKSWFRRWRSSVLSKG